MSPVIFIEIIYALWLLLCVYLVGAEDELMEQQFPTEYPSSKKRTKALIPFIW